MPKKQKPVVVLVTILQAVEMYHRGFAEISTGEIRRGGRKGFRYFGARKPEESFLQFAWLALRTGGLDLISLQASPIP